MEINASSSVGSAASQEFLVSQATKETNKEKPSVAQDKALSSPDNDSVNISSSGAVLSARAEGSEESNSENNSEQSREANKTADATRLENKQIPSNRSTTERINNLNDAVKQNPTAVYSAQANIAGSAVAALFA